MYKCSVHGLAPLFIYSPALLAIAADGTLPNVIVVEVKDAAEDVACLCFNITPAEATSLQITDGRIPYDSESLLTLSRLPNMCGVCFNERRWELFQALQNLSDGTVSR